MKERIDNIVRKLITLKLAGAMNEYGDDIIAQMTVRLLDEEAAAIEKQVLDYGE